MALRFLNSGYFAGKVGIGTDSPAAKLHVNPTTTDEIAIAINGTQNYSAGEFQRIAAGDASSLNRLAIGFGYDNPTDWAIRYSSYGRHEFYTGNDWGNAANTEKMVITSSGNVGIGTNSPNGKLSFENSVETRKIVLYEGGNNDFQFYGFGIEANKLIYTTAANTDDHVFYSGASATTRNELMRIDGGGNVGIGTTSPGYKLQVNGTIAPEGNEVNNLGTSTNRFNQLWAKLIYDINNGRGLTNQVLTSTGSGGIAWANASTVIGGPYLPLTAGSGSPLTGDLYLGAFNKISGVTGDNLVIGVDTNNSSGASSFDIQMDGSTSAFYINNSRQVGIGTTSIANAKLKVSGGGVDIESATDSLRLRFYEGAAFKSGIQQVLSIGEMITASAVGDMAIRANAGNMLFATGGSTERMRIDSSGKVGIGTVLPGAKLDVNGNVKIKNALLLNQENTNVDTGTEAIASVVLATYTAAFFDFVIKKGTNVRSGTVYACHDGTNVEFTETSTNDLGDTSDVTLNVVISSIYLQLQATTTSNDWSIKSLIRAI
jgi:hypothetical protein